MYLLGLVGYFFYLPKLYENFKFKYDVRNINRQEMKRTGFVLNFPTEFATTHLHKSGRKCSFSLDLAFLFYSRKKKMISGVPSLVMSFKYYLQNCFIFFSESHRNCRTVCSYFQRRKLTLKEHSSVC